MENLNSFIRNSSSLWSKEKKANNLKILCEWKNGVKKPKEHYNLEKNYRVKEFAGIYF